MPRRRKHCLVTQAQTVSISTLKRAGVFERLDQVHFFPLAPIGSPYDVPMLACVAIPALFGFRLAVAHQVISSWRPKREVAVYWIPVEITSAPLGGERYWFLCPARSCSHALGPSQAGLPQALPRGGHRRVLTLYLPPGANAFACRDCHGLTYRTRQLHYPSPREKATLGRVFLFPAREPRVSPLAAASRQFLWRLEALAESLSSQEVAKVTNKDLLTLRQEAVWCLWGMCRRQVQELAPLFRVSTRTIKRELAALRARGWRRARPGETSFILTLDLIAQCNTLLEHWTRFLHEELEALPPGSREKGPLLYSALELAKRQADLARAAAELTQATHQEGQRRSQEERQLLERELRVKLATLVNR